MARSKVTLTLDREKARTAMELAGARSISDAVDVALDRLVHMERLRRDVAAYQREPTADEEAVLGDLPVSLDLGDEDVDYDDIYGKDP